MQFVSTPYTATPSLSRLPATTRGMVTTPQYCATQAGVHMLRRGGTAIDAAVAAAAVLAVAYPHMCSLGGDGFWLIHEGSSGRLLGINASGRSGERADRAFFAERGFTAIPPRGPLSACTVPGVVSGWEAALELSRRWGSPLGLADVLEDALDLAEGGFVVTPGLARMLEAMTAPAPAGFRGEAHFEGFADCYLPGGRPPRAGERLRSPHLAGTLSLLVREGLRAFYEGALAERMTRGLREAGGLLTAGDFAAHRADWVPPLSVSYRGFEACNLPPNTQGPASLAILNILEQMDVPALGEGSADYIHAIVEATKLAFAERDALLTDPEFVDMHMEEILSPARGREMANRIHMGRAAPARGLLEPGGDTCWFGVVDAQGNAVSVIQSLFHEFGSGVMAGDTGVLLQNRGCFFSLDPRHVNRLEPRKRTLHTLNPPMLRKGGRPFLVYGTMGGEGQPQTQAALVTRMVDFSFAPQDAVAAPRWLHGRSWGAQCNSLRLEGRIPPAVARDLTRRGHPVELVEDYSDLMGHAGAILLDPQEGLLYGAADPRSDGQAAGY